MKSRYQQITVVSLVALVFCAYLLRDNLRMAVSEHLGYSPTHEAHPKCEWTQKSFAKSGITFFVEDCHGPSATWVYEEDSEGRIIRSLPDDDRRLVTLEVFTKDKKRAPLDVVRESYEKLTPEEQKRCEIINADQPLTYFPDGTPHWFEEPRATRHKTRYKISVKREVAQSIWDRYGGMPAGEPQYDFMCGHVVGSRFGSADPYFEFDDRSQDKYLFISSFGNEGSDIDLNSIRF